MVCSSGRKCSQLLCQLLCGSCIQTYDQVEVKLQAVPRKEKEICHKRKLPERTADISVLPGDSEKKKKINVLLKGTGHPKMKIPSSSSLNTQTCLKRCYLYPWCTDKLVHHLQTKCMLTHKKNPINSAPYSLSHIFHVSGSPEIPDCSEKTLFTPLFRWFMLLVCTLTLWAAKVKILS